MILFEKGNILASGDTLRRDIVLGEGESMHLTLVAMGSELAEAQFNVDINGAGADFVLNGIYLCKGEEKLNVKVDLHHNAGGSHSNQNFRGIVDDKARASFDGRIVVAHDAQKTEAYQTNHNLQLSDFAVVQTSPQLEIYADDVKCSHGATVGSLNLDEQFYMRSRGISEKEARRLQMQSFLAQAMDELPEEIREDIFARL